MKRKQLKVNRAALNFARREASEVRRIGHEDVEAVHSVRIFEKNVHNCLNLCEKINRLNVSFLPRRRRRRAAQRSGVVKACRHNAQRRIAHKRTNKRQHFP
jgi:hypothetical protein